jgi:hypothetical protein
LTWSPGGSSGTWNGPDPSRARPRSRKEILKSHTKDLASGAIDYRRMFSMIKSKLARDRNLILG